MSGWILLAVYLACWAFTYAITFAYFHNEYPILAKDYYWSHIWFGLTIGAFGPFGLIAALACSRCLKYGLKWY